MMKRRQKRAKLRFNMTQEDDVRRSPGSIAALALGTAAFCAALFLAFDTTGNGASTHTLDSDPSDSGTTSDHFIAPQTRRQNELSDDDSVARQRERVGIHFERCGTPRFNCVVDGDTFWLNGEKIRIADIDTPEIGQPRCKEEYLLGIKAAQRLTEILNEGGFVLVSTAEGDVDRYGRKLRVVKRGDVSVGDQLLREGLAHKWRGKRLPWCQSAPIAAL